MHVSASLLNFFPTYIQTLMSASTTMEVATTYVTTLMEVTHVSAMMTTSSPVMHTHVKV